MEVTGAPAVSTCWFQCSESTYVPIFWTSQLRHKDVARKKTEEVWTLLGTSHSKTAQAFLLVHFRETQKDWIPPEPAPGDCTRMLIWLQLFTLVRTLSLS